MAKKVSAQQLSPKSLAARKNGALGGKARAKKHSKQAIQEWGKKGGISTISTYGIGFFSDIRKKRGKAAS